MKHQVDVFLRKVLIGGEQSRFIMLTRCERELQLIGRGVCPWHRAGAADWAFCIADTESIPVPAIWGESVDLGVHGVRELWRCARATTADDLAHGIVFSDFPGHL